MVFDTAMPCTGTNLTAEREEHNSVAGETHVKTPLLSLPPSFINPICVSSRPVHNRPVATKLAVNFRVCGMINEPCEFDGRVQSRPRKLQLTGRLGTGR